MEWNFHASLKIDYSHFIIDDWLKLFPPRNYHFEGMRRECISVGLVAHVHTVTIPATFLHPPATVAAHNNWTTPLNLYSVFLFEGF